MTAETPTLKKSNPALNYKNCTTLEPSKLKRLNLGCGTNKIDGCINIDINEEGKPDVVWDFRTPLPYGDGIIDTIYLFHTIEHLPKKSHPQILFNMRRVLKDGGRIFISYPEFTKCAQNFIYNHKGKREFWEKTIYGRQLHFGDYHISLMYSPHFSNLVTSVGFKDVTYKPEPKEDYNTILTARRGPDSMTLEDIYRLSWFTE